MRNEHGLTLAELLVSMGLAGGIALTAAALTSYAARAEMRIEKDVYPEAQANMALENISQRVMRAAPIKVGGQSAFYEIRERDEDGAEGPCLRYKDSGSSRSQRFCKRGTKLNFCPSSGSDRCEEMADDVDHLSFEKDEFKRLIIEIRLKKGHRCARTAIAPRTCPHGFIN